MDNIFDFKYGVIKWPYKYNSLGGRIYWRRRRKYWNLLAAYSNSLYIWRRKKINLRRWSWSIETSRRRNLTIDRWRKCKNCWRRGILRNSRWRRKRGSNWRSSKNSNRWNRCRSISWSRIIKISWWISIDWSKCLNLIWYYRYFIWHRKWIRDVNLYNRKSCRILIRS